MKLNTQIGSGLLETVLAVAVLAIILTGFVQSIIGFSRTEIKAKYRSESALAAQEGIEVAYNLARTDWDQFSQLDGIFHPVINSQSVSLESGSKALEINSQLQRSITITQARRDSNTDVISDSGNLDPNTRRIESSVYWGNGSKDKKVTYVIYISNLIEEETE